MSIQGTLESLLPKPADHSDDVESTSITQGKDYDFLGIDADIDLGSRGQVGHARQFLGKRDDLVRGPIRALGAVRETLVSTRPLNSENPRHHFRKRR